MFARNLMVAGMALGLAAAPVGAVTLVSSIAGAPDMGMPLGFQTVITFDTASAAGIVNVTSGTVITAAGSSGGVRAAPAGTPVGGVYQSVGNGGTSSFDFAGLLGPTALTGFSVYWGSVDSHNNLDFFNRSGELVSTIPGSALPRFDGNQTLGASNRRLTWALNGPDDITRVVFRGRGNAFEYDTIGITTGAVPEPGTWAMLIAGFGLVGTMIRRRRRITYAIN